MQHARMHGCPACDVVAVHTPTLSPPHAAQLMLGHTWSTQLELLVSAAANYQISLFAMLAKHCIGNMNHGIAEGGEL